MTQIKSVLFTVAVAAVLATSCKKDLSNNEANGQFDRSTSATTPDTRLVPSVSKNIPNVISSNLTLDKDTLWIVNGPTYVTNNATLTIEAGAFVKGQLKSVTANNYPSFLLVTRGAKLIADGTVANPIVFTSIRAAGSRLKGDWGGIVLLGRGTTNIGVGRIEGVRGVYASSFGLDSTSTFQYGNTSDNDNSGTLRNVRVEFAGDVISEGNELNGITFGAVGYNTILENVQVSNGADDAFEFFGGAVNGKNLIAYGNDDDDFDFDQGYVGTIQFAAALKNPALGVSSSPNSIESNNVTSPVVVGGSFSTKLTRPTLVNFTLLGRNTAGSPSLATAALFRENSGYIARNFVIGGFTTGVNVSAGTATGSSFSHAVIHSFTSAGSGFTNSVTSTAVNANAFLLLVNPFVLTTPGPDFRYQLDEDAAIISPAHNRYSFDVTVAFPGGVFPTASSLNTTAQYSGAFGPQGSTRWDATWSSYSPDTNPYLP